jgi:hypothetical protein
MLARSLLELAASLLGASRLRREKLLAFRKLSAGFALLFLIRIEDVALEFVGAGIAVDDGLHFVA